MRSLTSEFSPRLERGTLGRNMSMKTLKHGISGSMRTLLAAPFLFGTPSLSMGQAAHDAIAIVGATIIDGNGGPPISNGTILVEGTRILAVGSRASVEVPADAQVIDGTGKYVTPGFIDTNVHMSLGFGRQARLAEHARYWPVHEQVILQGLQLHLKYGVTTVRDSYGVLRPMQRVKKKIDGGEEIGPRTYLAGNIVGWGGAASETFSGIPDADVSFFEEQMNDEITLGSGEEWAHMTPDELRIAVNAYLDYGPDFIKYGGTHHFGYPSPIMFSPRAQRVIVEETHKRDLVVETHSTSLEGLRLSVLAGLDLIQHPEILGNRVITDELVELIVDRGVVCSMLTNTITGEAWEVHLRQREAAREALAAESTKAQPRRTPLTSGEIRRRTQATGLKQAGSILEGSWEARRETAIKLIERGCITTVGTDNLLFGFSGLGPGFTRSRNMLGTYEESDIIDHQRPGIGTIIGIEGLVELGMTPAEAIVAATKNGAIASKALDEYGTLEAGKAADIVVLDADPLADISNIRSLALVIKGGRIVDIDALPTNPIAEEIRR
jgi:imidazolonepropionase-like amidohydrolase